MPIVEKDPWRQQYFDDVACPDDVTIPTDDELAYRLYPDHRWIYSKLQVAESQGLKCAPHGIVPDDFPVFSKPIMNLRGMGTGGQVVASKEQFERIQQPGHMWMPMRTGEHVSTDGVLVDGTPKWWRHTVGLEMGGGTFNYWTVEAEARPALEDTLGAWTREHLRGYTGAVNLETIDGTIIEAHLRFADQWPDLYGEGWLDALVRLYADGTWTYADDDRRTGYSVVLFGGHGMRYAPVDRSKVAALTERPAISSVQITFHEDRDAALHAMPPGGFRLAIVNCWDLDAGLEARQDLATLFVAAQQGSTPQAAPARL
jgi:hypothetical protein